MTAPTDDLPTPPPPGERVNRYGRHGALTPELEARIVQVVSAGNYLKTAAQFCGISAYTLSTWLTRGRAAAAAIEAHPPDRSYCPACDLDRTEELGTLNALNSEDDQAQVVLDACYRCGSSAYPEPWELPEVEERYHRFLQSVTQAETVAEVAAVTHWRRAFADDWRAARDYLGRKRPEQWAAKTTISISSEEAEARIERATLEALTALGVDTPDLDGLDLGEDDPASLEEPEPGES